MANPMTFSEFLVEEALIGNEDLLEQVITEQEWFAPMSADSLIAELGL